MINASFEVFDEVRDLDALAGDGAADGTDPHYADLPCYVSLDDEYDDAISPFIDGVPMDVTGRSLPRQAFRA